MSLAAVAIDRSSLSKEPLVIASDGEVFRLTEDGVGEIVQSVRIALAPPSNNVDGDEATGYSRGATALPLEFHIIGASTSAVMASVAEVEEALYRLAYPVSRLTDGVVVTYMGGPCALVPKRAVKDSAVLAAHFETYAVAIPFLSPHPLDDDVDFEES